VSPDGEVVPRRCRSSRSRSPRAPCPTPGAPARLRDRRRRRRRRFGAATGPWLAQRRSAIWTLADHEPPLADRRVEASASALSAALAEVPRPVQGRLAKEVLVARWEAGLRAHQNGDVDTARAAYSALIDDQPDYAPALHFRARLEWDAGDLDAAARDLASALDAAPGYADARVDASRLALERQQPLVAIALAKAGVDREPAHLGLLCALGHAMLRVGDGVAAAEAFSRASMLQPFDAETQYNLGVAQQLAGDVKAAVQSYRHASAFDPSFVDAAFNLGVLYQQQGRASDALAAYRQVLDRDPARDAAWKNVGELLREEGRLDEWAANFRRFEAACPVRCSWRRRRSSAIADFRVDRYLDGLRQEKFRQPPKPRSSTRWGVALPVVVLRRRAVDPASVRPDLRSGVPSCSRRSSCATRDPEPGRLRIGYLSADLRNHVMGR
jgi:tetratricopeptide (TPR) repeat protein